jgi:predicted ester cyclase
MSRNTELHAFATRYFSYLDGRNIDGLIDELFAPGARFGGFGPQELDREGVRHTMRHFFEAFPDSRMPVDGVIAEGDEVAIRHRFEGTHRAPFQGIAPTGKRVVVTATVTLRVVDNAVQWGVLHADMLGMMMQLGVVPPPGR